MIKFERYPHIADLLQYYSSTLGNEKVVSILNNGITNSQEAKLFSLFVWQVVDAIHEDKENRTIVLGSDDNIELIPDLEYEVSSYMRSTSFLNVWLEVSENA